MGKRGINMNNIVRFEWLKQPICIDGCEVDLKIYSCKTIYLLVDGYEYQHPIIYEDGTISGETWYFMCSFEKQPDITIKNLGRGKVGNGKLEYYIGNISIDLYIEDVKENMKLAKEYGIDIWKNDSEYEDFILEEIVDEEDSWTLCTAVVNSKLGLSFCTTSEKVEGITPKKGDIVRCFKLDDYALDRGVILNPDTDPQILFYRTREEDIEYRKM